MYFSLQTTNIVPKMLMWWGCQK